MKVLVCISKTPDTTAKIAFTEGNTKFDENGVQWIINPYDEWYALVRALELGVPAIYFIKYVAKKHGKYAGMCNINSRLFLSFEKRLKK